MKAAHDEPRLLLLVGLCVSVSGCGFFGFFSQTVKPQTHESIHDALPAGLSADEAEARLNGFNFDCAPRSGDFLDENGSDVVAPHYLTCVARSGEVSFRCENRDQVFVSLVDGVVDRVAVVRGPNCTPQ